MRRLPAPHGPPQLPATRADANNARHREPQGHGQRERSIVETVLFCTRENRLSTAGLRATGVPAPPAIGGRRAVPCRLSRRRGLLAVALWALHADRLGRGAQPEPRLQ